MTRHDKIVAVKRLGTMMVVVIKKRKAVVAACRSCSVVSSSHSSCSSSISTLSTAAAAVSLPSALDVAGIVSGFAAAAACPHGHCQAYQHSSDPSFSAIDIDIGRALVIQITAELCAGWMISRVVVGRTAASMSAKVSSAHAVSSPLLRRTSAETSSPCCAKS